MPRIPRSLLLSLATVAAACDQPTATVPSRRLAPDVSAAVAPAPQRARWRVQLPGDYSLHSAGVANDGTVYVSVTGGGLYAVAPDGHVRWVASTGGAGSVGPVSVGADGTIYAAGSRPASPGPGSNGAIFAFDPSGAEKWHFDATNQLIMAGPSIGPDGNIYAITQLGGAGLFSLTPTGTLRFQTGPASFVDNGYLGEEIGFGSSQLYFAFDMAGSGLPPSMFAYDFNGNQKFRVSRVGDNSRAAVAPNGNVVIESFPLGAGVSLSAYAPTGSLAWNFYQFPGNTEEHPDVGPDNVAYTVRNLSTLFALTPSGGVKWTYVDANILSQARVRPQNDLLFMGGRLNYGQSGFVQAVSTNGAALWRVMLPDEPGFAPYGQLVPISRPVFSPDGNTAYVVADVAGDGANPYCFLYAIDVSPGGPTNAPPVATIVATSPTSIAAGGSVSFLGSFTDPDVGDGPWSYRWVFGNGRVNGTATAPGSFPVSRTYAKAGTYKVALGVMDARGGVDTSNVVTVLVH